MAYCRWVDCDVYVYADGDRGWKTHIASRRNAAGKAPDMDFTSIETLMNSYKKMMEWHKEHKEYVNINLPNAGKSFWDATPGECADRLEVLREEGFDVPQYAIDDLRKEALEEKDD